MHEFNLIQEYFTWSNPPSDVVVAVGDDAAVLDILSNQQLVTCIDTLIAGVHFPEDTPANAIGHKALAVNLSDLAAMGATPKWFTLALTLPEINKQWLNGFSAGLKQIAQEYGCFLIGGDTTRGPLSISIQVMGLVDKRQALLRSSASVGDKIYVTGTLGDAALGLQAVLDENEEQNPVSDDTSYCVNRLNFPTPRLIESDFIKDFASSCIDISDGLLQDLSHILESSKVGAQINLRSLPLSDALTKIKREDALGYALAGGDDYELLFTLPLDKESSLVKLSKLQSNQVTCIGFITDAKDNLVDENGNELTAKGYNHFHE